MAGLYIISLGPDNSIRNIFTDDPLKEDNSFILLSRGGLRAEEIDIDFDPEKVENLLDMEIY